MPAHTSLSVKHYLGAKNVAVVPTLLSHLIYPVLYVSFLSLRIKSLPLDCQLWDVPEIQAHSLSFLHEILKN